MFDVTYCVHRNRYLQFRAMNQVTLETSLISGYPPPTVSWTKNNQELISLEGKLSIKYDHNRVEVILNDATVQDAGKYTCKVVNNVGSASSTADIVVKKTFLPPIFGRRLQARSVKEGERVVMEVEITGIPDPDVTWYKDGQQILSTVPDSSFRTKVQGNCYSLIIEKVSLDNSGQYLVKAVNSKGEAASMADIVVNKQESPTETIIKVVKEDIRESEIEEIISTFTSEVQKEKKDIKPVPVKPVHPGPPVKQYVRHSLPSPSKFVKGEFRESDYESDYESRIPAKWRPGDSDADEPKYKPVHPLLAQKGFSQSPLLSARTPTPPTEFDNPPEFSAPPRPKFEPIEKPSQSCKTDVIRKSSGHHQKVFKPKPITPKTVPPIIATPDLKSKESEALKPGPCPEIGYAPPPPPKTKINIAPFEKATQIETSKIMNISESTEHMHRVVNVQQTTHVIRFGEKEREVPDQQSETFPFKTDLVKQRTKRPVLTTPKKFVPGDFYESEYESDLEAVKIKPKWTPGNSDTEEPHYRKVRPPQITHSTKGPLAISSSQPPTVSTESNLAATTNTTQAISIQKGEVQKRNVSSVEKIRTFKSEQNRGSQPIGMEITRQQDIQLQPGEPPEFCFAGNVASVASYVTSKHMSDMTNTFRSKAQQFASDIMTDVGNSRPNTQPEKIITKQDNSKDTESEKCLDDPQAYREESRVSEYGTKHIDPDTGLIYFKYDFGYEFGIVLPNEGKKQEGSTSKYPQIDRKQAGDIEVPVIHEKNTKGDENITSKATETKITPASTKVPQFKPKKFTHFKAVKWEPASESEMSEAEGDSAKMKKSYISPQSNLAIQKEPHIHIPPTQWGPAPTSPLSLSLSPSLPSLSPCTGATLDSTASPGGSWQGLSPIKSPRVGYGRGNTPTPPSTPSTPRSTSGIIPQHFCKPPSFITTLRDITVMKGQPVCFECIVQAEPLPNILWAKDGRLLENSLKHQLHFRNGVCRLTLSQASPDDSGNYTCTATNKLGTVKTSGLLQVPEVTLHFEDQDEAEKEYFAHWKATNVWSDVNIHSSDET
ncbi:Obscurin, partial [Gryllus bimaculatus]